jgi:hypothetical protein
MGEWSKKVGEAGEAVAKDFLRLIGWGAAQHGVPLPCARGEAHKNGQNERKTHGVDYFLACKSPLGSGIGHNLVVSVKYSAEAYPANPKAIFKDHFRDLAHTLECFKLSEVRRTATHGVRGVTVGRDIGVLLWINNDRRSEADVVGRVSNVALSDTLKFEAIFLVDNKRAGFIYDSVEYARQLEKGCEVTFFYHETGASFNPELKLNDGRLMPVEYINSSVLALKIASNSSPQRILMLSTLEAFSQPAVKRLLGLAQHLSQGWCSRIVLAFPDYTELEHENLVQEAKACFSDIKFTSAVDVGCYDRDFRSVGH